MLCAAPLKKHFSGIFRRKGFTVAYQNRTSDSSEMNFNTEKEKMAKILNLFVVDQQKHAFPVKCNVL